MERMSSTPWLRLSVVVALAVVCVTGTVGMIVLSAMGKDIPPALIGVVAASMGSLSSFLVMVPVDVIEPPHTTRKGS